MGILLKLRSHLNLLLEGAALRAIKGEVISEANYKSAIEILMHRKIWKTSTSDIRTRG
jgi:hypothetical protein